MSSARETATAGSALADYRGSHSGQGYAEHYAKTYERGFYRRQWELIERPLVERVLRDQFDAGARRLIDFACGTGRIAAVASEILPDVLGVDVAEGMLEVARARCPTARFRRIDLTREPFAESADVVTAFRFFLNADPDLREDALLAIHRILEPAAGALVANVHVNARSPLGIAYRARNAVRRRLTANTMSEAALRSLLEQTGFVVESIHYYSLLPRVGWWFPDWLARLMVPAERLAAGSRAIGARSQCFLVVARPRAS